MTLKEYLCETEILQKNPKQEIWNRQLQKRVMSFENLREKPHALYGEFEKRVRTEELKAWYSCPDPGDLFQGTSVSSLVIPATFERPLDLRSAGDLEEAIADRYIAAHDAYAGKVRDAIVEPVDAWIKEGLFYGIVLPSKVISQAFDLVVDMDSLVVTIDGIPVDPHEITSYPVHVREEYFRRAQSNVQCLGDVHLSRREFESSLALSDVSKPNMKRYRNKAMLGPVRCNEIAALIARHVKEHIRKKTKSRITPRSLEVVIYDTDTPYTYHEIMGYNGNQDAPCLPGLVVLGASGSIDAFRWLYSYRVSLIAQKIMKGSLYSQTKSSFVPFAFMGVLVPRDAQILLDMDRLDLLRYEGNISPETEFAYMAHDIVKYTGGKPGIPDGDKAADTCALSD